MNVYDKTQVAASFGRAAAEYDAAAVLQQTVGERLIERLDYMRIKPKRILDVGCGTGLLTRRLAKRFPLAKVIGVDIAPGMIDYANQHKPWLSRQQYHCADIEALPYPDAHFDFIFSSMMLHWATDLEAALRELRRVLKPNGLLLLSSLGPDTLRELRLSWQAVDDLDHVHPFIDMHHVGDCLLKVGFADPVMDMEMFTLTYPDAIAVMRDLKTIGAHNLLPQRHKGLTGKSRIAGVKAAYETYRRDDGTLPLSYEVFYGNAWGAPVKPAPAKHDEVRIAVDQIKKVRE